MVYSAMSLFSFSYSKFFWGATIAFSLYFLYVANSTTIAEPPSTTMDPYQHLHIILHPNGTITRLQQPPQSPPSTDPNLPNISVLSKDLTINPSRNTWLRIYLPHQALNHPLTKKLPLLVFFHGGGFILYSAASTYFHDFCVNMANDTQSVVVSVNYRRAPEHRLPAAYDDAVEALHWIRTSRDHWLTRVADYSNCYLMGESAGGNIAYNAGLRAAAEAHVLDPVKIRGLILVQPFFGRKKRTASEIRLTDDPILPLPVTDLMWELSLPVGADRDNEYCNPTAEDGSTVLDKIKWLGWRIIVFGCDGDPLVDREMELVKLLKDKGLQVDAHFHSGDRHGVFVGEPTKAKQLYNTIKRYVTPLLD